MNWPFLIYIPSYDLYRMSGCTTVLIVYSDTWSSLTMSLINLPGSSSIIFNIPYKFWCSYGIRALRMCFFFSLLQWKYCHHIPISPTEIYKQMIWQHLKSYWFLNPYVLQLKQLACMSFPFLGESSSEWVIWNKKYYYK